MCYGMNCKFEKFSGECGKPTWVETDDGRVKARCPQDQEKCDSCGEYFWEEELVEVRYVRDNLPAIVCEDCSDDEDIFKGRS